MDSPHHGGPRSPTTTFTGHQLFYIFVMNSVGGFCISGAINFGVAYAMYAHNSDPIWLVQLPTTLLGDAGVTVILQSIITWLITLIIVNYDLGNGGLAPVGFISEPRNRLLRWFMFLEQRPAGQSSPSTTPEPTAKEDECGVRSAVRGNKGSDGCKEGAWATILSLLAFIVGQAVRGFVFAVPFFAIMIGPTMGILVSKGVRDGSDWVFSPTWTPQIFKLLYGGILGLLQGPVFVLFWATRCGWAIQNGESSYGEKWLRTKAAAVEPRPLSSSAEPSSV